jgi:hypothetical protein
MTDYLKSSFITEEKVRIQEIPAVVLRPREAEKPIPSIIFYHGWSSNKELQRLRGFILASAGYQVALPDAVYHGERNPLPRYDDEAAIKYFWDVIFNNVEEYSTIVGELVLKYNADAKRIAVMGNSMGGFTAGGIFANNRDVKVLTVFNGSCGWEIFNENIEVPSSEKIETIRQRVKDMNPMNNLDMLKDRPILLLHGDSDTVVPIDSQRIFYNKLNSLYNNKDKIKFIEYPRLNHFVTTNMMEESINWLGKYL